MENKSINLRPLPYGMGTMTITIHNNIEYKKMVALPDGRRVRKTVHGKSQKECLDRMKEVEESLVKNYVPQDKMPLIDAMLEWLQTTKQPTLKRQAYNRELGTIKNQIGKSDIAHFRYQSIKPKEIQELLNTLNEKGYSYSVIKKTYDSLNAFYRFVSAREHFENPMTFVSVWRKNNVTAEEKEVVFFENDDIKKFIDKATEKYATGTLKYANGYILSANIYLGLRIGELLALKWEDIDFTKNTIYVNKTLIEIPNPNYDATKPELMKNQNIKKVIFEVQKSTKRNKTRYVPMNENARTLILQHFQYASYTLPNDFVISTRTRHSTTTKNISDTIKCIVRNANLNVQKWNTHILRHTCASLYFRAGVDLYTISQILGNSVEVLQTTYVHLIEEQLQAAAQKQIAVLPNF